MKALKAFRHRALLTDLSPAVRKLIVNFGDTTGLDISLDRSQTSDTVLLASGDPIYGKITNGRYAVRTFFGDLTLEAKDVLGMAGASESLTQVRFVLTDGQVVSGLRVGSWISRWRTCVNGRTRSPTPARSRTRSATRSSS